MNKNLNRYLCTLEFRSGEHGVPFYHIVKANSIKAAEEIVHKWLKQFYPGLFDEKDGNTYYYIGSEVAVKIEGICLLNRINFIQFITIN